MALQDIFPINGNLQDTLVEASKIPWIENTPLSATKVLYTGAETGSWAVLFRWKKGHVAAPHKHLSASHTFILKGKLKVRDGILNAGDYVYEPNGVLHGATEALEDTEYLFICNGPIIFYDDDGLTTYKSWEEIEKMRRSVAAPAQVAATAAE
jgi:quercetin dioxygenase-like cupin family protein